MRVVADRGEDPFQLENIAPRGLLATAGSERIITKFVHRSAAATLNAPHEGKFEYVASTAVGRLLALADVPHC